MKFRHRERSSGDEFQISNVNYKFSYRVHIETDGRRSPAEIADEVRETLYTCPDENSSTRGELVFFFFYNRRWWRSCWKFHLLPKQYRRLSNFPIPFIMDRSRLRRIGNSLARLNMGNLISSKLPRVPSEFKAHGAAWFTRIASSRLTLSFRYTVRYEGNVVSKLRCLCAFSVCLPEIYTRRCMLQRRGNAFKSLSAIAHTHTRTHTHTRIHDFPDMVLVSNLAREKWRDKEER